MADRARIYRALLKLYPARFREEFERPLEQQFRDDYEESRGGILFWTRVLADLAVSVPLEFARELRQDLRYSFRIYARRPWVTILAVAALAMAIGATTGVFSVVNALLLRSLPFRNPESLVLFSRFPLVQFIPGGFKGWEAKARYLSGAAPFMVKEMNLVVGGAAMRRKITETSAGFFSMLGSETAFGRAFLPDEDTPGKDSAAVISFALWQQAFSGDPHALGSVIKINGSPMTIVGVARPGFDFPDRSDVWTPTAFNFQHLQKTGVSFFRCIARLAPGLTLAQATSMMQADVAHLYRAFDGKPADYTFTPLRDQLSGSVRQASFVLLGSSAFVLLIACANIANLLLARVAERRTELAVRAALGASRARLIQQLITESLVLAAVAALAGLFVAQWTARLATAVQPVALSAQEYTIVDWRVLAFAAALAGLTGLLFGVVPAYVSGRTQSISERRVILGAGRVRRALVGLQVAFALVLVAGSIVMARSFLGIMGLDLGFRPDRVAVLSVSLAGTRYDTPARERDYSRQALEKLRAIPGIEAAGMTDFIPLDADLFTPKMFIGESNLKVDSGESIPSVLIVRAGADYFKAMGTGIIAGREFNDADREGSDPVAVVNEAFAQHAGGGDALIGRKIPGFIERHFDDAERRPVTIVGISRSLRYAVSSQNEAPQVFLAAGQFPLRVPTFAVRTRGRVQDYVALCRDAVQSIDREVAVFGADTLEHRREMYTARPRFYTAAVIFLGAFALLLAIVGMYGVASYSVAQRMQEIGVRMAIGASAGQVRGMILGQSLVSVLAGLVAGVAGAAALGRYLQHLIDTAQPAGFFTLSVAALSLALTAAAALWSATRRVERLNPVDVLRSE